MSVIEWDKKLSVGIGVIDALHKNLIGQMNNIALSAELGARPNDLAVLLRMLRADMRDHCDFEEALMDPMGYSQYKLHRNEHLRADELLAEFHDNLLKEQRFSLSSYLTSVVHYFYSHIRCVDRSLGEFARDQFPRQEPSGRAA